MSDLEKCASYLANNYLALRLKVIPKASRSAIEGVFTDAEGVNHLKVKVTAAPEDGKANKAVIELLAKTFHIPKSKIEIVSGSTSQFKTVSLPFL